MSYRPVCDTWILARPKVPYYGAYPAGFPERARALLGVSLTDPVLHVCSGMVLAYPYPGAVGPHDLTLDANPDLNPDFVVDVTTDDLPAGFTILTDPPYTEEDAAHYGSALAPYPFPTASALMAKCLKAVHVGQRVGMLHYVWPRLPEYARQIAVVGIPMSGQRIRQYTVYERTA